MDAVLEEAGQRDLDDRPIADRHQWLQ